MGFFLSLWIYTIALLASISQRYLNRGREKQGQKWGMGARITAFSGHFADFRFFDISLLTTSKNHAMLPQ